ncbi:unannotated protein [freshwater metagenome]|uniref:Unannotated protein n=1 Tax=freshwater metagenome TaxID=449393 RepID=A0A6J7Y0E5_9ZZZZ|nr:heavy metal translocating P-type ATPase [Actinomycetota bacterium]
MSTALESTTLQVGGMTCNACVNSVERSLNSIPGVNATVNFGSETVHILAPAEVNIKELVGAIEKAGYTASSIGDSTQITLHNRRSAYSLFFALLFSIPAISISMIMSWHMRIDDWLIIQLDNFNIAHPLYSPSAWLVIALSAPVVLVVAWPIHRAALRNLFHPTMDNLISMGSLSAFGWSIYANSTGNGEVYTEVATGVITFVVLGRFLESRAKRRASSALSSLLALGVKEVSVLRGGLSVNIPIDHLKIDDEFIAMPGSRIATDGIVISGSSSVDNSLLTGESLPIDVSPGLSVIGSALNNNGRLVIRATRIGSDTEFARITSMVIQAQSNKAPIQRLADRISAIFVPVVTLVAIGTYFAWQYTDHSLSVSIGTAISVLVIACPCALGLATPVALLVASGRGAQKGIVLRQPRVLEVARKIDTVLLDKTGTLTTGTMKVLEITIVLDAGNILEENLKSLLTESNILTSALSIEEQSEHPIARAIRTEILSRGINPAPVSDFAITPGSGAAGRVNFGSISPRVIIGSPTAVAHSTTKFHPDLQAAIARAEESGFTISVLGWDSVALAVISVGDHVKVGAEQTLFRMREMGITPWLITGDSISAALSIARQVGISSENVIADAMPQDKLEKVSQLRNQGKRVLMIGDGVNDAAALAAADLSMAMGTGTDVAISSADITLMRPDLEAAIDAIKLSKKTLRVIRTNLGWAFAYNVVGIPIAAAGLLSPMYAAGAMALSSLFVVTNSLRIK